MLRKWRVSILLQAALLFASSRGFAGWGIDPDRVPEAPTDKTFPNYAVGSVEQIWGFVDKDVRNKDFTRMSLERISGISFDRRTQWPPQEKLPKGFSPAVWMEACKDPGLGVRDLHAKGITGKGVAVAVIDKPIRSDHKEFGDRMIYEAIGSDPRNHFHGLACASIAAGSTCGVAPGARIHYFATPASVNRAHYYALALNRLVEVNKELPEGKKIRVVSISDGISMLSLGGLECLEAIKETEKEGIAVIYSDTAGLNFLWSGCPPSKDRNDPNVYAVASYLKGKLKLTPYVLLPASYRTTAENDGESNYRYWGEAGFSWAMPYLSGLAVLAWQIDPSLKYDEIRKMIIQTATPIPDNCKVVNPKALLDKVMAAHRL